MKIKKRNGEFEDLNFHKISRRIESQVLGKLSGVVDPDLVTTKVIQGIADGISAEEIDILAYETAAAMITKHPDYSWLASRLAITTMHKTVPKKFSTVIESLHKYIHPKTGGPAGLISDGTYKVIMDNKDRLDSAIIMQRDFDIDFFGYKTLERSYLLRTNGQIAERIQHFWMRVSVGIWGDNIDEALKTYELLSTKRMIHATPTLFNAGTKKPQMSSCFLLQMKNDSIKGIYDTLSQCADISQSAGGIGLHISNVRATGTYIKGTNGTSNGIVPMLRNFDMTARYVDQCFIPETKIKTNKGLVSISDIKEGDSVLTSDGNYNIVNKNNKFENEDRKFVTISTNSGVNTVTDEHLYLVAKNGKGVDNLKEKIKSGHIKPMWVKSGELTTDDLLIKVKFNHLKPH